MRPQGSPISSRPLRGAIPRTAPGPKLCPNVALINTTQHQKACVHVCWGTPVEFGCLLTYRQLISGCRAVRNLSPTGALFLFHDVRLYDPERRLVRGPPRKCLGMCRRVTNKGESGFGIANDRGTVAVEWKHHRCDRLKRRRDLSMEVSVLRGWDPKVPVGSPVSFPKRSNPAWRLVAPSSPCRINTKSKHQALVELIQKVSTTNTKSKHQTSQ